MFILNLGFPEFDVIHQHTLYNRIYVVLYIKSIGGPMINNHIKKLVELNYTVKQIALETNLTQPSIRYRLKKLNLKTFNSCKPMNSNCEICDTRLTNKQRKYCSAVCKSKGYYKKVSVKERGYKKRLYLVNSKGGCCELCGYKKNLAAFNFHHIDPSIKLFNIDIRACTAYNIKKLEEEADKCMLLCSNCHSEIHYPQYNLD